MSIDNIDDILRDQKERLNTEFGILLDLRLLLPFLVELKIFGSSQDVKSSI
jgi:hypothetical protein